MSTKDLVKLNGEHTINLPAQRESNFPSALQRDMTQWMSRWDRTFDSFFERAFGLSAPRFPESQGCISGSQWQAFTPAVNVSENEHELRVTAELPGMDPKEIELSVNRNTLTITGEKKNETEDKGEGYHRMERSYGAFRRTLPLPEDVDTDNIDAQFKSGVLTLVVPKLPQEKSGKKKILIKS